MCQTRETPSWVEGLMTAGPQYPITNTHPNCLPWAGGNQLPPVRPEDVEEGTE